MLKLLSLVVTVLALQHVDAKPFSFYEQSPETEIHQITKPLYYDVKEFPRFDYSWSLPSFPSFSIGHWFKNNDDTITVLKKRVDALEVFQNEVLQLLKQLNVANTSPSSPTQLPDKGQIQEDFGNAKGEEEKPENNDTVENIKKEQTQSDSTTIKATINDSVASETTPFTIIDNEAVLSAKANEKETVTPSTTDDTQANASLNENESENNENAESTEKPEKLENLDVASSEFDKSKIDESAENQEYQKFGKTQKKTSPSIERTTEQTNEKDIKTQEQF